MWRGEVEDGSGWDGLVPSRAEREAEREMSMALKRGRAEGCEDERQKWLPLAGELRARILHKRQTGGTVLLSMEDVLAISCELKRAERTTA